MFFSGAPRSLNRAIVATAVFSVIVAVSTVPAGAREVSTRVLVSSDDQVNAIVSSTDGCVESTLSILAGRNLRPKAGSPPVADGTVFYTRYDECTGEYLAGINQGFIMESGGVSLNGALKYGTARFTTSAVDQVTHGVLRINVDFAFTAAGDTAHNHNQAIVSADGFTVIEQDSEWFRRADVTGTFSVGGVGGVAGAQYASMSRGNSTLVIHTFGPSQ